MNSALPPAVIFIAGALFVPFFKGRVKQVYLLALPFLAGLDLLYLPDGHSWAGSFLVLHSSYLTPLGLPLGLSSSLP